MILIYDLDIEILKAYPYTKNEVCSARHSKIRAKTGQTDAPEDIQAAFADGLIQRQKFTHMTFRLVARFNAQ